MIIQTNIDRNDIADALRGTKRGLTSAAVRLAVAFVLLIYVSIYGLLSLYGAFSSFGQNVNQRFGAPFAEQAIGFVADLTPVFFNILCLGLVALLWLYLYRAAKALRFGAAINELKHGLSVGKRVVDISETYLVVKTPLKAQKIAWAAFDGFEETKTSLIFHRADGGFELIPKGAVPAKANMETLCAELAQRVAPPLSRAGGEAAALRLTYEFTEADNDAFRRWRWRERATTLPLARRLVESPRVVAAAFCFFGGLSAASFIGAAIRLDASLLSSGVACAAVAAALVLTHQAIFWRIASQFGRRRRTLCAQTNPTTVTLSNTGVFCERRGESEVYQWEAFDALVQTQHAAYLVLSPESVIALPKRAFMDEAHYERLTTFATVRLADATREKTSAQMNRLQKSAAPSPAPKPILQIAHRSDAERSDDSQAAPGHKRPQPIRAAHVR